MTTAPIYDQTVEALGGDPLGPTRLPLEPERKVTYLPPIPIPRWITETNPPSVIAEVQEFQRRAAAKAAKKAPAKKTVAKKTVAKKTAAKKASPPVKKRQA